MRERRHFTNLFPIANARDLALDYRLVRIAGLPDDDTREKNLNLLLGNVSTGLQQPVALTARNGMPHLAVPFDVVGLKQKHQLAPNVVELQPLSERLHLDFARLTPENESVAISFLTFALRKPLMRNDRLWRYMGGYYESDPQRDSPTREADAYAGFGWRLVVLSDGRICIALDSAVRYLDRRWLNERFNGRDGQRYLHRHAIYHLGYSRYAIQIAAICEESISQKMFVPKGASATNVYDYTRRKLGDDAPPWIAGLDPNGRAIIYNYPNRREKFCGALALCKLTLKTDDPSVRELHQRSALSPRHRMSRAKDALRHFNGATLGRVAIQLSREPVSSPRRIFAVPDLIFGNGQILSVAAPNTNQLKGADVHVVDLPSYGKARMELLEDPVAGPLDVSPFMEQYLIQPLSLDRQINDDFHQRMEQAMRRVAQRPGYTMKRVLFDDRRASTLPQQIKAIRDALAREGSPRGYALLILPANAREGLHNYLKRNLLPNVQIQCATAGKIRAFYRSDPAQRQSAVRSDSRHKYDGFIRNLACAMLILNRKWPWAIRTNLGADVFVGIDVLNGTAGFTFVYQGGRQIIFREAQGRLKEKLSSKQICQVLLDALKEDIARFGIIARRITIHRDGKTYEAERKGIQSAIQQLVSNRVLPADAQCTIVAVQKSSSIRLRLFDGNSDDAVENPTVGSAFVLNAREGVVCCTGWPFHLPGTAQPLLVQVADGSQPIHEVLSDVYALAQLAYASPTMCLRVPLTIKLTDDLLEPIAANVDMEDASYDDIDDDVQTTTVARISEGIR